MNVPLREVQRSAAGAIAPALASCCGGCAPWRFAVAPAAAGAAGAAAGAGDAVAVALSAGPGSYTHLTL
ncbi:hypothetical protein, partial [Burkholderia pseudomallei]|uniref:hypothetical protein n=1 Tax=Burkholderia pseudomallei TaxID=28450 RepID=UPI001AAE3F7F